jgi:hypothetical protein
MRITYVFISSRACLLSLLLGSMVSCKSAPTEGTSATEGLASDKVAAPAAAPAAAAPRAAAPAVAAAQALPVALAAERAASCTALCKKTEPLKCPAQNQCKDTCLSSFTVPICSPELGQFLACTSQSALAHFDCDPESGNPMLKDGYCDKEQEAVVNCLGTALQLQAAP